MGKFKVLIKIHPGSDTIKQQWSVSGNTMKCAVKSFEFDHIFGQNTSNADVYAGIAPIVEKTKNGNNAIVFSYGQKGSGKTYTMIGGSDDPGINILAVQQLFEQNRPTSTREFVIRVGYMEIYNEILYDLLNRRQTVHITRQVGSDIKLTNKEVIVNDKETVLKLLQKGNNAKTPKSSADAPTTSHAIFQIIIESQEMVNGPIKIGRLSLVDLDRSEGAQIKNEQGVYMDQSLKSLELAIAAISKGEKFRNNFKSKLTRLFKLDGNADVAIICNINPTSLNQTLSTLNFADAARNVKTKALCKKTESKNSIMELVRADIIRLTNLKRDSEALLQNASRIDDEIADLESILIMEKTMKPRRHLVEQCLGQVLKIRPFFASITGMECQNYQIGELKDKSIDAQSRCQRKNNVFKWTDFYLERVGVRIECGHAEIFKSSNGTIVNGVKYKGKTVDLHVGDVISIVGGRHNLSTLVGNFDCTVYRLCKFTNEQRIQTYEVDDDVVIEIHDDASNDTCYFPVKMELEMDTPPTSIPNNITEPENVIEIDDDSDDDGTFYFPVKMEVDSVFVEVNTEPAAAVDGHHHSSSAKENESEFDLQTFVFGNVTIGGLHEIDVCSIPINDQDVNVSNLQTLAGELEEMSKIQLEYETDKKVHAEQIRSLEAKIEQLNSDLNVVKRADATKKDVIAELQLKLLASTHEKNALTEDNLKLSSNIDLLIVKLKAVEKDRDQLREKNMKHIEELMAYFKNES